MDKIRKSLYQGFSKEKWRNFEQHKYENEFQIPFRINTVDRFQGMERNIIIVSTVRSNEKNNIRKNRTKFRYMNSIHFRKFAYSFNCFPHFFP